MRFTPPMLQDQYLTELSTQGEGASSRSQRRRDRKRFHYHTHDYSQVIPIKQSPISFDQGLENIITNSVIPTRVPKTANLTGPNSNWVPKTC